MIQVVTQKQAQDAYRRVRYACIRKGSRGFCYICGQALEWANPSGAWHSRGVLTDEHLVPKKILQEISPDLSARFPLVLPVHNMCDIRHKKTNDEVLRDLLLVAQPSKQAKFVAGHGRKLAQGLVPPSSAQLLGSSGLVGGDSIRATLDGVWTWIRGFHSILYGKYLSVGSPRQVDPPFFHSRKSDLASAMERIDQLQKLDSFRKHLWEHASGQQIYNRATCWGEEVEYVCVWIDGRHIKRRSIAQVFDCHWILRVPGVRDMLNATDRQTPGWCGRYTYHELPTGVRSLLVDESGSVH